MTCIDYAGGFVSNGKYPLTPAVKPSAPVSKIEPVQECKYDIEFRKYSPADGSIELGIFTVVTIICMFTILDKVRGNPRKL